MIVLPEFVATDKSAAVRISEPSGAICARCSALTNRSAASGQATIRSPTTRGSLRHDRTLSQLRLPIKMPVTTMLSGPNRSAIPSTVPLTTAGTGSCSVNSAMPISMEIMLGLRNSFFQLTVRSPDRVNLQCVHTRNVCTQIIAVAYTTHSWPIAAPTIGTAMPVLK